jgi:hypothetical protein
MANKANSGRRSGFSSRKAPNGVYRLNALEQQLSNDMDWAQTAPEVQKHQGQYVIVHHKRVIAAGSDRRALLAKAALQQSCPESELAVVVVPPAGPWEIPS